MWKIDHGYNEKRRNYSRGDRSGKKTMDTMRREEITPEGTESDLENRPWARCQCEEKKLFQREQIWKIDRGRNERRRNYTRGDRCGK